MRIKLLITALAMATGIASFSEPAAACGDESYVGAICAFPFNWCPVGFLPADGRPMQVAQAQALYSLIGNQYGGNASVFNLPDLRGRVVVGAGTGNGLAPVQLAQPFGQQYVTPPPVPVPAGTGQPTVPVASSQTIPTQPPSMGMTVCIAVQGIYPARP